MAKKKRETSEDVYFKSIRKIYDDIGLMVSEEMIKKFEELLNSGINFDEYRIKKIKSKIKYLEEDIEYYKKK